MRKMFSMPMLCLALVATACADNDVVSQNLSDLPTAARNVLNQQFPDTKVSYVKIDKELFKPASYNVRLVNGTKITFNNNGEWTEVDCKKTAVPPYFIPDELKTQAESMFPGEIITKIEKESRTYEVELGNGIELTFSHRFKLKEVD